mgnify:CR=1 FL=1
MEIVRYWHGKKRQVYTLPDSSRAKIIHALKTRKISEKVIEHTKNLNKGKFGKNHPCYREEKKHKLYKFIRETYKYRQWRKKIFERDGYRCQGCTTIGGYLTAHHIKSFAKYPELRFELDNGTT